MRRLTLLVALLVALAFAASASAAPVFVLIGRGWGHGVGMSQWGAYGLARGYAVDHPYTWQEIMGHYFRNTTIGRRSKNVSVLLIDSSGSVTIGPEFRVEAGSRSVKHTGASSVSKTSTGRIKVGGIRRNFTSPARFSPTGGPLSLGGRHYRGDFVVSAVGGGVRVVNSLGVDAYVRGVVTNESPSSWGDVGAQAALEAQAVAARSYGLWTDAHGGGKCGGHLCPDTRDQVYGGFDSETHNGNKAVRATVRKVVLSGGAVAETFFSSSSGGRTAASVDTWGGNVSYLRSTRDPADLNPDNPNRAWTAVLSARALQKRLGAGREPADAVVSSRASGRVNRIRLERGSWARTFPSSGLGPEHFRSVLGVRSSRFELGVLDLTPNRTTSICGARVRLDLLVRFVRGVTADQRPLSGGRWKHLPVTKQDADSYTAVHKPCRGTEYRLHSPAANTAPVAVRVAARIVFRDTQPPGGVALRGLVEPSSLAGQTVKVDRKRKDGSWNTNAGTAVVRSDGKWRANFHVVEGVYRARIRPPASSGLVRGVSPPLAVKFG